MSTISTSGIAPSSVIRAEHVLRVINALSNNANNDILISGSLIVTGSTDLSGSLNVDGGITGSIFGTASNATSASYALNSSNATSASYALTASYAVSASYEINYETSSSYAENATSASYALTASYVLGGGGSAIDTGSFATTGSNIFRGNQTITGSQNITGSINVKDGLITLDNSSIVATDAFSTMAIYPNIIVIEDQGSPFGNTLLGQKVLSYNSSSNSQQLLFPASLSTGIKAITLPNDTGTVALTYNTATTGSNTFIGNQTISGSALISGSIILSGSNAGVNSSTTVRYDKIELDNPTFGYGYNAKLYSSYLVFDDSNILQTLYGNSSISKTAGLNTQNINFPDSLSGGTKTVYFPNDNGTVALTYNTATKGSNQFSGSQGITGSVSITSVLTLVPNDPLPAGQPTGSIAVSGSGVDCKPYFWNGATWTSMI